MIHSSTRWQCGTPGYSSPLLVWLFRLFIHANMTWDFTQLLAILNTHLYTGVPLQGILQSWIRVRHNCRPPHISCPESF